MKPEKEYRWHQSSEDPRAPFLHFSSGGPLRKARSAHLSFFQHSEFLVQPMLAGGPFLGQGIVRKPCWSCSIRSMFGGCTVQPKASVLFLLHHWRKDDLLPIFFDDTVP